MPTSDKDVRAEKTSSEASQTGSDDRQQKLDRSLNVIAAQLVEPESRQIATPEEILARASEIGRDAEVARPRSATSASHDLGSSASADHRKSEAPMALKSANAPYGIDRRQAETVDRRRGSVDNFDVIESSLSGDDIDPWDRQSAEALASIYDVKGSHRPAPVSSARASAASASAEKSPMSEAWLESRFAEIGKSIERSLASRSETDYDTFGRKLDHVEQRLSKKFDGVATQADISVVRLIEAHVGEVVNHLVQTHDQLARLNAIEEQLGHISQVLADAGPVLSSQGASRADAPAIDVDAIVRAAAEQTAQRFAESRKADRNAAADDLRPLIERLAADSRKGSERTAKLLDTMQQAIVRIMQRVDSLEVAQQRGRGPEKQAGGADMAVRMPDRSHVATDLPAARVDHGPSHSSQADRTKAFGASEGQQPPPLRNSERQRHDFIADARRARNRLSVADEPAEVVIATAEQKNPEPAAEAANDALAGSRPIQPMANDVIKATSPSGPSTRLVAVAVGLVFLLGGLWYTFGIGDVALTSSPSIVSGNAAPDVNKGKPTPAILNKSSETPAKPELDANGKRGDIAPLGEPRIQAASADVPAPRTTLPLIGIAVDVDSPITAAGMQQAIRHQTMATMSGEIGAEAAKSSAATAIPASIVPSESQTAGQADVAGAPNAMARSKRLSETDMPPATLGPLSLRLAAANGDPSAQFEIGARFADGRGKTANFNDAAKWYQKSADKGFAQAQYRLGTLYERGLGLKPDRALAVKWYELAAAQGNIKAMHNLAVLSANSTDKSPDYAAAAHWFEEAAKRDLSDSQFNLAILYENGLGVPRDMTTAFKWLSLAAREGDGEATRRRDILRGKLTAQEMAAAKELVAAWKPVPYDRMVNDARAAGEAWKKNPNNGVSG